MIERMKLVVSTLLKAESGVFTVEADMTYDGPISRGVKKLGTQE